LVLGKNAQGGIAVHGIEDLHDWMAIRTLLSNCLKRADATIFEESAPELKQLPH
jgi:hypothetical protein